MGYADAVAVVRHHIAQDRRERGRIRRTGGGREAAKQQTTGRRAASDPPREGQHGIAEVLLLRSGLGGCLSRDVEVVEAGAAHRRIATQSALKVASGRWLGRRRR